MRTHLIILIYGAILLLPFLDNGTVLSRHEVLASEPAREMVESDVPWSIQTFAGEFRTAKPPTMSWLIAGGMKLFDSRSEFVCRLPAALAALVTAHAIAIIGTRLLSPVGGLLSGLITLTTYWLQMQARLAEADMPLVACVTVAMIALLPPGESRAPAWRLSLLFYVATGLGFMLKLVAPMVTIPAAIMLWAWTRDPHCRKVLLNPVGLIAFIVLLSAWPAAAYLAHPQIIHDWWNQTIVRSTGQMEGHEPVTGVTYIAEFFFYFWTIPWILLPATPAAAIGLYTGFDKWKSPAGKFLIAWVGPFLVLLTVLAFKHKHYALPILPAFSVLAAYGTLVWARTVKPRVASVLGVAWFVGCALVILGIQWKLLPKFDDYRPHAELAWLANEKIPAGAHATLIGLGEAHVAYYLTPVPDRIDDVKDLPRDRTIYGVCTRGVADALGAPAIVEAPRLRRREAESDRLVLVKIN